MENGIFKTFSLQDPVNQKERSKQVSLQFQRQDLQKQSKNDLDNKNIGNFYVFIMSKQQNNPRILISKNWIRFSLSTYLIIIVIFVLFQVQVSSSTQSKHTQNLEQQTYTYETRKLYIIDQLQNIKILDQLSKSTFTFANPQQLNIKNQNQKLHFFQFFNENQTKNLLKIVGILWLLIQIIIVSILMILNPGLASLKSSINKKEYFQDQKLQQTVIKSFCNKCQRIVDISTYHCDQCGVCFVLHEHHCFFMGKCITKRNKLLVQIYLFTLIIGILFTILIYVFY